MAQHSTGDLFDMFLAPSAAGAKRNHITQESQMAFPLLLNSFKSSSSVDFGDLHDILLPSPESIPGPSKAQEPHPPLPARKSDFQEPRVHQRRQETSSGVSKSKGRSSPCAAAEGLSQSNEWGAVGAPMPRLCPQLMPAGSSSFSGTGANARDIRRLSESTSAYSSFAPTVDYSAGGGAANSKRSSSLKSQGMEGGDYLGPGSGVFGPMRLLGSVSMIESTGALGGSGESSAAIAMHQLLEQHLARTERALPRQLAAAALRGESNHMQTAIERAASSFASATAMLRTGNGNPAVVKQEPCLERVTSRGGHAARCKEEHQGWTAAGGAADMARVITKLGSASSALPATNMSSVSRRWGHAPAMGAIPKASAGDNRAERNGTSSTAVPEKKLRRMAANREAARRMRKRHSERLAELETEIEELLAVNQRAAERLTTATARIAELEHSNKKLEQGSSFILAAQQEQLDSLLVNQCTANESRIKRPRIAEGREKSEDHLELPSVQNLEALTHPEQLGLAAASHNEHFDNLLAEMLQTWA